MSNIRDIIRVAGERRKSDRRAPAVSTTPEIAEKLIAETKYTGVTIIHWHEGVKKRIEFPYDIGVDGGLPIGIELRRHDD